MCSNKTKLTCCITTPTSLKVCLVRNVMLNSVSLRRRSGAIERGTFFYPTSYAKHCYIHAFKITVLATRLLFTFPNQERMLRITHERCFLWRQNHPEVNYSPIRISAGECFLRKYHAAVKGQMAGTCGYGEELSSSINAGNFLTSGKVYC
jgi:hypothetical protein